MLQLFMCKTYYQEMIYIICHLIIQGKLYNKRMNIKRHIRSKNNNNNSFV